MQKKQNIDWWILAGSAILSLVLGMLGFSRLSADGYGSSMSFLDLLYRSLQLFTLESGSVQGPLPISLEVARWLAPFTTFFAAIKGVLSLLHKRGKSMLRLRNMKNHAIVSGTGDRGSHIVSELLRNGIAVVTIDGTHPDTVSSLPDSGVIRIAGNPHDADVLQHARIRAARYLFAVTDDDAENISTIHEARKLVNDPGNAENNGSMDCFAHVTDVQTRALFYTHPLFSNSGKHFNAQLFSLYDRGARLLFEEHAPDRYRAICRKEAPPACIMIFGFSPLAKSLVVQAARIGHYANRKKMVVTIVDEQVVRKLAAFSLSVPELDQLIEMDLHDIPASGLSEAYLQHLLTNPPDVIYICADSNIQGFTLARRLAYLPGYEKIPTVVALSQTDRLTRLLCEDGLSRQGNVTLFPLLEKTADIDQITGGQQDEAAKIIHEMYCEDQLAQGQTTESNASLAAWENLPESLKDSNRGQADHLPIKLRAIGLSMEDVLKAGTPPAFTPEQIHRLADMEHRRWMAGKRLEGWRPATGEKDDKQKLTPLLVDFDELPAAEKRKDEQVVVSHSLRLIENLKLKSVQPRMPGKMKK